MYDVRWLLTAALIQCWKWEAHAQVSPPDRDWAAEIADIEKDVLDKDWRDYVNNIAGEYEELPGPTPTNDEDDFKYLAEFIDWNPTSPREIPFLAILFVLSRTPSPAYIHNFPNDPDPGLSRIEPGSACGGAILSPTHVMTSCGCLQQLIASVYDIDFLFPYYDLTNPIYNLYSHRTGGGKPPDVFVTFQLLRFVYDTTYELDRSPNNWPKGSYLNCVELIRTAARTPDQQLRARRADAKIVVVPFFPRIQFPAYFSKWPPHPLNDQTDSQFKEGVIIASMGMRLTEKTKIRFESSVQVSSLEMEHCNQETKVCNTSIADRKILTHICLCAVNKDRRWQLVGGVIGWPVVDKTGRIIGLTVSERNSQDGTVLVAVLHRDLYKAIETYIGLDVLDAQNTPPIVYRGKDLQKEFNIYDYWAAQYRTPNPRSLANTLQIKAFHFFPALFLGIPI